MPTILLSAIIAVACNGKFEKEAKVCEKYLLDCYYKELKADWSQKYVEGYRKALVLQHCREMGGYTK